MSKNTAQIQFAFTLDHFFITIAKVLLFFTTHKYSLMTYNVSHDLNQGCLRLFKDIDASSKNQKKPPDS